MRLLDLVRSSCAQLAAQAHWVSIDLDALARLEPGPPPALDPDVHFLDGDAATIADYFLTLDTINFGSGWFPTLNKPGGRSGYITIASALAEHWRQHGPWTAAQLRGIGTEQIATILGQRADHELMALYSQALRELGRFLGERGALDVIAQADGSAERLATTLAQNLAMYRDLGFYKRAQIAGANLALAGVAQFEDLDRLTIFADNLVPHVLRCEGVLVYEASLAARIDNEMLLHSGRQEREIRACALSACEVLSERLGMAPRELDNALWTRGQLPQYKARPRHRCRCVYY